MPSENNQGLSSEEMSLLDAAVEEALSSNTESEENNEVEETVEEAVFPTNSETLNVNEATTRFSGAQWFEAVQKEHILIAGIGGIGSWTAFMLSRLHPATIIMYDPDTVEQVNLAGQFFKANKVGVKKVNAVADMIDDFGLYNEVICIPERYTRKCPTAPIMICGFDNMEARKTFYYNWKSTVGNNNCPEHSLFIDGRLSAEELQVFCIKGDDEYSKKRYEEEWLFDDSEAEAHLCSYKQTSYMANMIGSIITNLFINFISNQCSVIERDLPFFTSYNAETMYFKTEA